MYRSTVSCRVQLEGSVLQVLTDQGGDGVEVVRLALEEGAGWRTNGGVKAEEEGGGKGGNREDNMGRPWERLSGRRRSRRRDHRDRSRR